MPISEPTHPQKPSLASQCFTIQMQMFSQLNAFSHQYTAIIYVSIYILYIYICIISYPYPIYPHIFHSHTFQCPKKNKQNRPWVGRTFARSKATTFEKFAWNFAMPSLQNDIFTGRFYWFRSIVRIAILDRNIPIDGGIPESSSMTFMVKSMGIKNPWIAYFWRLFL